MSPAICVNAKWTMLQGRATDKAVVVVVVFCLFVCLFVCLFFTQKAKCVLRQEKERQGITFKNDVNVFRLQQSSKKSCAQIS